MGNTIHVFNLQQQFPGFPGHITGPPAPRPQPIQQGPVRKV